MKIWLFANFISLRNDTKLKGLFRKQNSILFCIKLIKLVNQNQTKCFSLNLNGFLKRLGNINKLQNHLLVNPKSDSFSVLYSFYHEQGHLSFGHEKQ